MRSISNLLPFIPFLVLTACMAPYPIEPEPDDFEADPREELPENPPVEIEVTRLGLGGMIPYQGAAAMELRLSNFGPAQDIRLELMELYAQSYDRFGFSIGSATGEKTLHLKKREVAEIRWIIPAPGFTHHPSPDTELLVVARGEDGRTIGVGKAPAYKFMGRHTIVLAESKETGLLVSERLKRLDVDQSGFSGSRDLAVIHEDYPDLWYEYSDADAVVMAVPWSSLSPMTRRALGMYATFGGTVVFIAEHCRDWEKSSLAGGATPSGTHPFGLGRVSISPNLPDKQWLAGVMPLPTSREDRPKINSIRPELTISYIMPAPSFVIAVVLCIVLLMGPVAHLVLVRMRKRELSWVVIPALSILLAGAMYMVSSGVKGERSAMETHNVILSVDGSRYGVGNTGTRLQSAEAGVYSLTFGEDQPLITDNWFFGGMSIQDPGIVNMDESEAVIDDFALHRFSSRDVHFSHPAGPVPLKFQLLDDNGLTIVNTSGATLRNVHVKLALGWSQVAEVISAGEEITRKDVGPGQDPYIMFGQPYEDPRSMRWSSLLYGAGAFARDSSDVSIVVAECSPKTPLMQPKVTPSPDVTDSVTTCVWFFPERRQPYDGVSEEVNQ